MSAGDDDLIRIFEDDPPPGRQSPRRYGLWVAAVCLVAAWALLGLLLAAATGCIPVRVVAVESPVPVMVATDKAGDPVPLPVVNPRVATAWNAQGPTSWAAVPLLTTATGSARMHGSVTSSGAFEAWADWIPAHIPEVSRIPHVVPADPGVGGDVMGLIIGAGLALATGSWGLLKARAASLATRALTFALAYGNDAEGIRPDSDDEKKQLQKKHKSLQRIAGVDGLIEKQLADMKE